MDFNMLQYLEQQQKITDLEKRFGKITKTLFGELMHDDEVDEEDKQRILEMIEKAGGYECLA